MIIRASVEVAAAANDVYDAAVDWTAQSKWMPFTRVEVTVGDGRSVGTEVVAHTGVGPLAAMDSMVVEVWQPPYRCEVQHKGRAVRGRGVFLVESIAADRARFIWEEHLPDGSAYGTFARLSAPLNRAFFGVAVRRFARWVEAGQR